MDVKIFAHRGASSTYAEHTRAAYLQALADGADGVECDLHLTADGALVLIHDDDLDRTSNGTGPVADRTLAELRELDFASWKGATIPPEYGGTAGQLLTLDELLDILAGAGRAVRLAIEFKYGAFFDAGLVDAALDRLAARGWNATDSVAGNVEVSFMSFHPEAVKYLAERVPAAQLCQLLEEVEVAELREELDVGPIAGHTLAFILGRAQAAGEGLLDDGTAGLAGPGVDYLRANPENAARWLAAGRTLRVWTVDSAEDLRLCLAAGVAEVTTNRTAEMRAMLGRAVETA
ncbi:glycerophosphodiester phosphodiesterase family protein [Arthrobacter sp. STN4]|uniref:glycerophosphodiester phosphodiesterase n=1 Tax=Arthrobacter sp. STN4 TaxID=2923276 RepID=UPI00211A833C|nr:glycerophosphodiester phosphodiesterase family protein [Arthrobacter sp. STN4]MCQ9162622.1 glycerophosphodiester phosphodiesterase [Arthrobacter sp. STN4]